MTLLEFMDLARRLVVEPSDQSAAATWRRWNRSMTLLRVLAKNPELAVEADRTACFSQRALRFDVGHYARLARLYEQFERLAGGPV